MKKILEKLLEVQEHNHHDMQDQWVVKIAEFCTLKGVDWQQVIQKVDVLFEDNQSEDNQSEDNQSEDVQSEDDQSKDGNDIGQSVEQSLPEENKTKQPLGKILHAKLIRKWIYDSTVNYVDPNMLDKLNEIRIHNIGRLTYKTIDTQVIYEEYPIPVRMYFPDDESLEVAETGQNQLPVIIYLHGNPGEKFQYRHSDSICNALSKYTRHVVINIDYRYAPEYKFPVGLQDCYEVTRQICMDEFTYGINSHDITVMGEGIGGSLAAVICHMAKDKQEFEISKQILICPVVNGDYSQNSEYNAVSNPKDEEVFYVEKIKAYMESYCSCEEDKLNPYFAPVLAFSYINLPSTLLLTAEEDPLREEGLEYARKLMDSGLSITYKEMKRVKHGYFNSGINSLCVRKTFFYIDKFLR